MIINPLTVRDLPSEGRSHRIFGHRSQRTHTHVNGWNSRGAQADEMEELVDHVGMDYSRIDLPAAKPLLCQSECVSDELCQAFTDV